jgi:cytoskeletal protein RodZ
LTELGKFLRETREQKNISLDELQEITKIQKRYLKGIEEGNYSIMPGQFYVRAFIKQYAEALGLDPDTVFEQFKNEVPSVYTDELPEQLSRVKSRKQISSKTSKIMNMLPKIVFTFFIIGIAIAVWALVQQRDVTQSPEKPNVEEKSDFEESTSSPLTKDTEKSDQDKEKQVDTKEEEPSTPEEEKLDQELLVTETSGKRATMELKNTGSFVLDVSSKGETWVSVKNGKGNSFFAGLLRNGESKSIDLSKETEVVLNIGKTPDTELKINGQVVDFPLNPNEKVQQIITIHFTPAS